MKTDEQNKILALIDDPLPGEMYDEDPEPRRGIVRNEEREEFFRKERENWLK